MSRTSVIERRFNKRREDCYENCEGNSPLCDSMNCYCGRNLGAEYLQIWHDQFSLAYNAYQVTSYLDCDVRKRGELETLDLKNSHRRHAALLKKSLIEDLICIGSIELALQTYQGYHSTPRPIWIPHHHDYMFSKLPPATFRARLHEIMPKSSYGDRPLMIQTMERGKHNTSYYLKEHHRTNKKVKGPEGRQWNCDFPISGRYKEEAHEYMIQNHLLNWMFFYGVRRSSDRLILL